jgi:hypothetical protein
VSRSRALWPVASASRRQPLGRDPAGAGQAAHATECPGVATWARGVPGRDPTGAGHAAPPFPSTRPAVRPCGVHGRKSRLCGGPGTACERSRLAAIRQPDAHTIGTACERQPPGREASRPAQLVTCVSRSPLPWWRRQSCPQLDGRQTFCQLQRLTARGD